MPFQYGLTELRTHMVAQALGGEADYSALDTAEKAGIDRVIDEGLLQFYDPPPIGGRAHQWSFLEIRSTITTKVAYSTGTITIAAGVVTLTGGTFPAHAASCMLQTGGYDYSVASRQSGTQVTLDDTGLTNATAATYSLHQDDYDLPSTFGELIGPLTYRQGDNAWAPLTVVDAGRIEVERMRQNFLATNQPWLCAVRPKTNDATVGTRAELLLWPAVAAAAVITIPHRVRPDTIDGTNLYPWGASDHAATILSSCRAVCEMTYEKQRGPYWTEFLDRLAQSIKKDSRNAKAFVLGRNRDTSDCGGGGEPLRNVAWTEVRHLGIGE